MDNKDEDFTDKKKIALNRADELKNRIRDYLNIKDTIPTGMSPEQQKKYGEKKKKYFLFLMLLKKIGMITDGSLIIELPI